MCTPGLKGLIFFMYCREQKQKQTLRTKTNLKKKMQATQILFDTGRDKRERRLKNDKEKQKINK